MKKAIVLLFITVLSISANAHFGLPTNTNTSIGKVNAESLLKFIAGMVKYPEKARLMNVQGSSTLLFTIKNGELGAIEIFEELGEGCDTEVLKALSAYPDFKSEKDGKYALRTTFTLRGANTVISDSEIPEGYKALYLVVRGAPMSAPNAVNLQDAGTKETKSFNVNWTKDNLIFRGASKTAFDQPKVIVDGIVVNQDFMREINPNNVEAISFFKGPSAIALYGVDAQFGAIVITTKIKKEPSKEPSKEEPVKNPKN